MSFAVSENTHVFLIALESHRVPGAGDWLVGALGTHPLWDGVGPAVLAGHPAQSRLDPPAPAHSLSGHLMNGATPPSGEDVCSLLGFGMRMHTHDQDQLRLLYRGTLEQSTQVCSPWVCRGTLAQPPEPVTVSTQLHLYKADVRTNMDEVCAAPGGGRHSTWGGEHKAKLASAQLHVYQIRGAIHSKMHHLFMQHQVRENSAH